MSDGRASIVSGMPVTTNVSLVKPLGSGGMGAVWLADHSGLNTQVVVKFMLGGLDANQSAKKRFKREAEAAAQVRSPHVVQMLDHGLTDAGVPFIVMEHLRGRDLGAVLEERGRLTPAESITIVTQVAKALTKVHAAGLLHRDIKPDNIFLCDGEDELFVKLLDFGIAKSQEPAEGEGTLDGGTKTGQIVGTPFYMSPEQVTAQKSIDTRSDLWALGVVTFETLVGKRPFDGPSFGALAVKIATGEPPVPSAIDPSLPPGFDAWFRKACARSPDARFASAREMAEQLRQAFEGSGFSLPPSGAMSDSSGSRRRPSSADAIELASTALDPSTPNPSASGALARSEGGAVVVEDRTDDAKRGSGRIVAAIVAVASIGVVGLALAMRRPPSQPASPAPKNAPAVASSSAPVASEPAPSADPSASAVEPDASPAAAASAAPSASASASASLPEVAAPAPRPQVTSRSTVKQPAPTASVTPAPAASSAKPDPRPIPSSGDPLY